MRRSVLLCLLLALLWATPILAQEVTQIRHTHYVLNVRSGAGLGNSVIGSVNNCDRLEVIALVDRWYEIKFGDGTAFVAGWYTAAGEPHCTVTIPTGASGAATTTTASAPASGGSGGEQTLDNFSGNACYGDMDCGDGSTPQSMFLWKTGWCAATISAGVANWTLQQCQAGLGLIPGAAVATTGSTSRGSSSSNNNDDDGDDDGGGGGGGDQPSGPQCPPGHHWAGPPYNTCISSGF